jgi:hypothetical protein
LFIDNYAPAVEAGYASNWLLDVMKTVKLCKTHVCALLYRQVSSVPVNEQDIRCSVEPIQIIMQLEVTLIVIIEIARILGSRPWKQ